MIRAISVSIKHLTKHKQDKIGHIISCYSSAVNFYIKQLWKDKASSLNKTTKDLLSSSNTRLTSRYVSSALYRAINIITTTKKSLKALKKHTKKIPVFIGYPVLNNHFIDIQPSKSIKNFDMVLRLSTLTKGKRICIPFKKTKVLNKWLSHPLAKLLNTCELRKDKLILFVEIPDAESKAVGKTLGADIGINKMLAISDHKVYGLELKRLVNKINNKVKGSKSRKRSYIERDNYINQVLNQFFKRYPGLSVLVIEDLKNLKRGKRKIRSKKFRSFLSSWTYSKVITRIEQKCQENRVCLVKVNPRNTSITCPLCGMMNKKNRCGEVFSCQNKSCNYTEDADYVGSINILRKHLFAGNLQLPVEEKEIMLCQKIV